jgi:GAF domain-containing protein
VTGREDVSTDPERALEASLAALAELIVFQQPLEDTLVQVASLAAAAIPGADGAGLTLLESAHDHTMLASAPFVQTLDEVQYQLGEGPCLGAVEVRATQVSGSLEADLRWPRFGPKAGLLGVHSALSLPLLRKDRVVGSLNVYGHVRDAFGAQSVRIGELFSRPAAVTAGNALFLEQVRRVGERLDTALASRTIIDRAIGIRMSGTGITAEEAFEHLRAHSQSEGTTVVDTARHSVERAVVRARERHRGPELEQGPT